MRIAVVVKQVPTFAEMALDTEGRLIRAGLPLELNPYCRRAVSQAVELAAAVAPADEAGASVTVVTLGPPSAEDALREAIAWGLDRGVETDGLLVTDPAFAGSDTLATARALAAGLHLAGPFDLILAGRNSVDADTGQVGPELAQLCDVPFLSGVRQLSIVDRDADGFLVSARCEHDDGWLRAEVELPAILSCAERLIEPAKVDQPGRDAVPAERLRRLTAADLGAGPWGQAASPTSVGAVKLMAVTRARLVQPDAPVSDQARDAVRLLHERNAFVPASSHAAGAAPVASPRAGDQLAPLGLVARHLHELHADAEYVGMRFGRQAGVKLHEGAIVFKPCHPLPGALEVQVARKRSARPELWLEHHPDATPVSERGDRFDGFRTLPSAAETDDGFRPAAESVGNQRDRVDTGVMQAVEHLDGSIRPVPSRALGCEIDSLLEKYFGMRLARERAGERYAAERECGRVHRTECSTC